MHTIQATFETIHSLMSAHPLIACGISAVVGGIVMMPIAGALFERGLAKLAGG